jgi:putative ABC transport system ATP-binding protein
VSLIEIRGLTKLYRMGDSVVRALDGVDLDIERGEYVAITGPSGSGKSTLMHLIGCLDRPTTGTCHLDGRDMSRVSDREQAAVRNKQIGFVFQTFNLINRTTALDNVGVPLFYARKGNTRGPARRALERVGLSQRAKHRPNELSGGERQRVAIARALVNDPLLLLADEPTGNLDTRTGEQIMALFRELNDQGVTIILVTHEHDVATQTHRIVQMRDGKVTSDRPTEEVLRESAPAGAGRRAPITAPAGPPSDAAVTAVPVVPDSTDAGETRDAQPSPRAGGAIGALICGIIAAGLALVSWVGGTIVEAAFPYDRSTGAMPPQPLIFLGLAIALGILAAIVVGIISIAWGARVRKRIRNEPVELSGRWQANIAIVLGALAVVAPCALSLLRRVVT